MHNYFYIFRKYSFIYKKKYVDKICMFNFFIKKNKIKRKSND